MFLIYYTVSDNSDVSATEHRDVYIACLVERNRFLAHLRRPHAQNMEVSRMV